MLLVAVLHLLLFSHFSNAFFANFLGSANSGCFCPPPPQCPSVQNSCPPSNCESSNSGSCSGQQISIDYPQQRQEITSNNVFQQLPPPVSSPIQEPNYNFQPQPVLPSSHGGSYSTNSVQQPLQVAPSYNTNEVFHADKLPIRSENTNSEYSASPRPLPPPLPESPQYHSENYRTWVSPPVDPPDVFKEKESLVDLEPPAEEPEITTATTISTPQFTTTSSTTTTATEEVDFYDANVPEIPSESTNTSHNSSHPDDKLTNDYSELSYHQKLIRHRAKAAGVKAEVPTSKCSDTKLKQIMRTNMVPNASISKQLIFSAARAAFGRNLDIICARSRFSYTVISSAVFCEVTIRPVTCFAFFQP